MSDDSPLPAFPDWTRIIGQIPYAAYLGVMPMNDKDGLFFHLPFRPQLLGNASLGALHGGVVSGFMENAALLHLLLTANSPPNSQPGNQQTAASALRIPKSIDFSIDYLRSASATDSYARCQIKRLGRRVAQASISLWQQHEYTPAAVARAHFLLEASARDYPPE